MPVYALTDELAFPPAEGADPSGLVAVGGDFRPERLALAYASGIFPWPHARHAELWFSPDPRFVIDLKAFRVQRSLRKAIRRTALTVRFDTAFEAVMRACARAQRPGQRGTWITAGLVRGYVALHTTGLAHAIEAYEGERLVGGLYGVSLGRAFFGESMFADVDDASKIAFTTLLGHLVAEGFDFVDCQVHTEHLARFGATEWRRRVYLERLSTAVASPTKVGPWQAYLTPREALARLESAGVLTD